MKNTYAFFLIAVIGITSNISYGQTYLDMIDQGTFTLQEIQSSAVEHFKTTGDGQGTGYKHWKRWEYDALRMTDENGYVISTSNYYNELARYNAFINQKRLKKESCTGDWTPLGPTDIANRPGGTGRLTSIAIDPNDSNHIIVGSQTGGVWKTIDAGKTWVCISDLINLRVYSLAIDPNNSNIYYWGNSHGKMYKSIDGGKTWTEQKFSGWGHSHRILINTQNSEELWVSDTYDGLFHSTDGGKTWTNPLSGKCYDIEFHPTKPNIVYASGFSVWRSVDGGNTFDKLNFPFAKEQPKMIAVSKAAPNNLYVLQNKGRAFEGLYISYDTGRTFIQKDQNGKNLLGHNTNGSGSNLGQAPRNMDIAVSDTDSNEIYIAGINAWRSLNAGNSFDIVSYFGYSTYKHLAYCHADIEVLLYHNNHLFIASDGGIYKMDNPSSLTLNSESMQDISKGLGIQQIYRIGLSQSDTLMMSIGTQDNGSSLLLNGKWNHFSGGDGTETCIIDNKEKTIFSSSQHGSFYISKNKGESAQGLQIINRSYGGHWVTPFEKDPNNSNTVYVGYDSIYKSTDLGKSFKAISQKIYASEIKIAPTGSDTIYAASGTNVYRTTDGGATEWERILYANYNRSTVNYLAIHPRDANLVAVAVGGANNVLVTRDGGKKWEIWDEDLPAFQALTIVWEDNDKEALYLGMDVGIYYSDSSNRAWVPFNNGLPNIKVNEIEINTVTKKIYAGTYGRGVWVSPLCNQETVSIDELLKKEVSISPNPIAKGQLLHIETTDFTNVELRLFNQSGILVHRDLEANLTNRYSIKTKMLAAGMYYLRINNSQGIITKKVIIY